MTGTKKIPGVVSVRMAPLDDTLYVKYDTRVTDEAKLSVAVQAVIDNVN